MENLVVIIVLILVSLFLTGLFFIKATSNYKLYMFWLLKEDTDMRKYFMNFFLKRFLAFAFFSFIITCCIAVLVSYYFLTYN